MAIDDIKKELEQRFAEPLKEFYKRRIIFWNDEDGEFKEEVNDLTLSNAKVLLLEKNKLFNSKKLLSYDDEDSNYLVYNPLTIDSEHDWLLDLKLYNEEYRADSVSRFMQDSHIRNTPELRNEVKQYKEFFESSKIRNAMANFNSEIDTKSSLYMSMLAVTCNVKERKPDLIIREVIKGGDDTVNPIKKDLLTYSLNSKFYELVHRVTGYTGNSVNELTDFVILSALSRNLSSKVLEGLESKYSDLNSGACYDMVVNWTNSKDVNTFKDIASEVTSKLELANRFSNFTISDLEDTDLIPIIDEVILSKLMQSILNRTIDVSTIEHVLEKRKTSIWYSDYSYFYEGIQEIANMKKFEDSHIESFHHTSASEMWNAYIKDYYQMDTMYRKFHNAFDVSLKNDNGALNDDFKELVDYVENEYKNDYLEKLNSNWTKVIEKNLSTNGYINVLTQQVNFYDNYVRNAEGKVFVIISDAMRYDVAVSLAKELEQETRCDVEINAQEGIFPTVTEFGMAALLPHKSLTTELRNGDIKVLVDNKSSEMDDRDGILKSYNENSVAIKYKNIITMKRDERRAVIKGKEIVYIYHDTIDASSHNDETSTFEACTKAISELKNLVNIICGDLNGLNVLITSDHGFLYTYKSLNEDDKMERTSFKNDIIKQGRRYVLTNDNANPDYLIPVKGIYNEFNMLGFAPRENIRLKGSGGLNFVHGGISLQEMCVPVIKYKYLRSGYKSYVINKDKYDTKPVEVTLLTANRKISNMIFNLSFYQKQPVKDNYVACTYIAYIIDSDGNVVSDTQKIVADKTSDIAKDREFKCIFNLKSQKFNKAENYKLVIVDEERKQVPIKEEVQIDIAMAIDEFDYFE